MDPERESVGLLAYLRGWMGLFIQRNAVLLFFLLLLLAGAFAYVRLNRQPFTNNAFLVADVRPVSAIVPGYISAIYVVNNQTVSKGDKLLQIYPNPYELAVGRLGAEVSAARAKLQAEQCDIATQSQLVEKARAAVDNAKYLSDQATTLAARSAVPQKEAEQRQQELKEARAQLSAAQSALDAQKFQYAQTQADIQSLQNQLDNAKVSLSETVLYARSDGIVTNLFTAEGAYLNPGDPVCAFVDTDTWWIQANFKETDLSMVKEGDAAEVRLWMYPGKVFSGKIERMKWNVNRQRSATGNYLQEVAKENEWFLLPQRLPVMIKIDDPDPSFPLHIGASAGVVIDAPNPVLRQILWLLRNN